MKIEVKLFAAAKQLAGADAVVVQTPGQPTLAELRVALREQHPQLADLERRAMYAVNADYVDDAALIPADAEVACIPPVSGG